MMKYSLPVRFSIIISSENGFDKFYTLFRNRFSSILVKGVQELTSISLNKFGSWFGSSTVLAIIEILTISSFVEKQSW